MINHIIQRIVGKPAKRRPAPQPPRLIITADCIEALRIAFAPTLQIGHEGVAYLLGRTDGVVTIAVAVFAPTARTSFGGFFVEPRAMATCTQLAAKHELQIVAQVHTHPRQAFHSDGDVEGAKIRYPGYASVVLPDYGAALPSLAGAAAYLWHQDSWKTLAPRDVIVIAGAGPWTAKPGTQSGTIAP